MDKRMRVLVVDDSRVTVSIVSRLLEQCGFSDIEQAYTTEEALQTLRVRRHSLVISDCNFASMSGVQFLMAVRGDLLLSNTCFILMTTQRDRELIADAMRLQADCILMKPFSVDVLRMKLADLPKLNMKLSDLAKVDVPTGELAFLD